MFDAFLLKRESLGKNSSIVRLKEETIGIECLPVTQGLPGERRHALRGERA